MSTEGFNPHDKKYQRLEDLPPEHQKDFVSVDGGGFVQREAAEETSKSERQAKSFNERRGLLVPEKKPTDFLQSDAQFEDSMIGVENPFLDDEDGK